jgi:Ca2+-dependent lipid-binding protein
MLQLLVLLQVLEGRGIVAKDFSGLSDPYVVVSYNNREASTRTVYKSLNPIFGDVMLFQENRYAALVCAAHSQHYNNTVGPRF